MAKSTNSRSMRYTCLDVRSPDVNFLRKVMSSSRHDGAAYSRHPCRQSADADIVSAFPLSFSTFLENINILRQTSSTWHRIRREFCVLESFQKPVAPAGYKNKQCRKQTSVLSGRIVTAYVPLRSATERERAAFLIPCQGLRGFDSISLLTFQLQQFLQHLVDAGGICLAFHCLHGLTYQEADGFFLAALIVLHRLGIICDHFLYGLSQSPFVIDGL